MSKECFPHRGKLRRAAQTDRGEVFPALDRSAERCYNRWCRKWCHRLFAPDADIADSWIRLKNGCPQPHDITMIRHELYEMELVERGLSQDDAHRLAQEKYDYAKECGDYHGKAHKRKMRR